MHWIEVIFRFLFAWIDKIIAWVIVQAYNLFALIADTNIFSEPVITMFNRRVYALLALFMLFKLSFSLVNYIVNPNDFSDQSKGFSKLITNVFVMLIALIAVPYVFTAAYELQGIIIGKNTIQKIVLGVGAGGDEEDHSGQIMAFTVYSAFITPNPDFPGMENKCDEIYYDRKISAECKSIVHDAAGYTGEDILITALDQYDAQSLLDYDLVVHAKKDGEFLFNYTPIISSICAGIVAWIILLFCIDVSVRVVKLGFLQLIAPIPIISYIDPQSSKDGMFKKWTKTCVSTYISVFVRLMAISFALLIINIIGKSEMTRISDPREFIKLTTHPFVKIFIMLGALMFAKELPKLISDLTGVELDGAFTLNPMKKIGASPYAAAAIGGVAGGVGSMLANFMASRAENRNVGATIRSMLGGLGSGATRGVVGGLQSDGQGSALTPGFNAVRDSNEARNRRTVVREINQANPENRIGWMERNVYGPTRKAAGITNKDGSYGELDKRSKEMAREIANLDQQEDAYRREYASLTMDGITTGIYNYDDYDFASAGIPETKIVDGKEVTTTIFDFDKYIDRVNAENATRDASNQIQSLDRRTYDEVSGIAQAIQKTDARREQLRKAKKRIDKGIQGPEKEK